MGLLLRAVEVAGPYRWRWLLVDERSGAALADHEVELDPGGSETEAFQDLYRFLRWRVDPGRRVAGEAEWVGRVGAWIGSVALGESIGRAVVAASPVNSAYGLKPLPAERLRRTYLHLLHSYPHQQNPIYIGFSLLRTRRTILACACR